MEMRPAKRAAAVTKPTTMGTVPSLASDVLADDDAAGRVEPPVCDCGATDAVGATEADEDAERDAPLTDALPFDRSQ